MPALDRPARARRPRGRLIALALAIAVNLLFVGVLVFSVTWQNRAPVPVTAELYAPPATTLTPLPARRLPELAPPKPLPPPPVLPPVPAPAPKPAPPPPPTPSQADIELKAKQEAAKKEAAKKEEAKKEAEAKKLAQQQARAVAAMQAQAQSELQARQDTERDTRLRAQAEAESRLRAQAEKEAAERARDVATASAAASAASRAEADWIDRIRSKIRGNVTYLPPESAGNPEAVFDVVQLPTGEVLRVQMRKSSGIPAYDDAVQRAIMKSSPLPPPPSPDLFQRELELHFRPHEP